MDIDFPVITCYHEGMSKRLKRLLLEARAWCKLERGRQSELADFLGVSRHAVSAWFAKKPEKHPSPEQALALAEFLEKQRRKKKTE